MWYNYTETHGSSVVSALPSHVVGPGFTSCGRPGKKLCVVGLVSTVDSCAKDPGFEAGKEKV